MDPVGSNNIFIYSSFLLDVTLANITYNTIIQTKSERYAVH